MAETSKITTIESDHKIVYTLQDNFGNYEYQDTSLKNVGNVSNFKIYETRYEKIYLHNDEDGNYRYYIIDNSN